MKRFFFVAIATLFITSAFAYAQTTTSACGYITASNYNTCCNNGSTQISYTCTSYAASHQTISTTTTDTTSTNTQSSTNTPVLQTTPSFGNQCAPINDSNYSTCCTGAAWNQNSYSCINYSSLHPQTVTPGTVGGGNPNTNPIFIPGNFNNTSASSASPTSQTSTALAQCSAAKFNSLLDILIWVKCIIVGGIIPLIFAAALVFFLWGVFRFIASSSPEKKKEGRNFIVAGLIGLFVMTSLWGLIKILGNTLGVQSTVPLLQTDYLKK